MKALTLRGIDGNLEEMLLSEARQSGTSMNATITKLLQNAFGLTKKKYRTEHHDLDHLAGTWTENDKIEFENHTSYFSKIDKDMWIAASALQHGATLFTLDSHFSYIDGLLTCNPNTSS